MRSARLLVPLLISLTGAAAGCDRASDPTRGLSPGSFRAEAVGGLPDGRFSGSAQVTEYDGDYYVELWDAAPAFSNTTTSAASLMFFIAPPGGFTTGTFTVTGSWSGGDRSSSEVVGGWWVYFPGASEPVQAVSGTVRILRSTSTRVDGEIDAKFRDKLGGEVLLTGAFRAEFASDGS